MRRIPGLRDVRGAARAAALCAALAAGAVPAAGEARAPRAGALGLAPCQLGAAEAPTRTEARCGTLEVPEDRSRPGGRTLRLRVAVIDAESGDAAPDPVFVLAGGPGQAITEVYPQLEEAFERVSRRRDVVLVDQRGTGGSARLSCPELPEPARGRELPDAEALKIAKACADQLSRSADLLQYGTDAFVRDLDEVRAALGYAKVNLVGFSYGTRAALVYARTFPDRVRALVLDGVAPMQLVVAGSFERDAQRALDLLLARCEADAACKQAHPKLKETLWTVLDRLEKGPVETRVRDPRTGEPATVRLEVDSVRSVVLGHAYASESAAILPPILEAAAGGDLAPLAAQHRMLAGDVEMAISRPLQLAVVCSEDVPFMTDDPPELDRQRFLGRSVRDAFRKACSVWPSRPVDPAWREPVRSAVPALLLSGEADPVTPPAWAERAREGLPNARHLVLAGEGHGVYMRGCVPRLAAEFLDAGSAAGLDAACIERARPAPIFLDWNGGAP